MSLKTAKATLPLRIRSSGVITRRSWIDGWTTFPRSASSLVSLTRRGPGLSNWLGRLSSSSASIQTVSTQLLPDP